MEPTPPAASPDRFAGTDPDPVPVGGILTIRFHDPDRAGQAVTVHAADAADPSDSRDLAIRLRGNGKGSTQWIVPTEWTAVVLRHETSRDHRVAIAPPP